MVEVASPNQHRPGIADKARRYLAAGVRLVWIVWPSRQEVDVWRPDEMGQPAATVGSGEALDGEDVLPGFTYPLGRLFA